MRALLAGDATLWREHGLRAGYKPGSLDRIGVCRRVRAAAARCKECGANRGVRWHQACAGGASVRVCRECTAEVGGYRELWTRRQAFAYASSMPCTQQGAPRGVPPPRRAGAARAVAALRAYPALPRVLVRRALSLCVIARRTTPGRQHLLWPHDVRAQLQRALLERAQRGRAAATKQRDLVGLFRRAEGRSAFE